MKYKDPPFDANVSSPHQNILSHDVGHSLSRVAPNRKSLRSRKKLLKISDKGQDLLVPAGTTVILGEGSKPSMAKTMITGKVDQFKLWIGRPDELADDHPWEEPSQDWSGKRFKDPGELHPTEISDIEKAGWIYLFNDSTKVSTYTKAIEDYHGHFEISVYDYRRVIIQPGARLIIRGNPSVFLIDELHIHGSGTFETYAICNVTVGSMHKQEISTFKNN